MSCMCAFLLLQIVDSRQLAKKRKEKYILDFKCHVGVFYFLGFLSIGIIIVLDLSLCYKFIFILEFSCTDHSHVFFLPYSWGINEIFWIELCFLVFVPCV